MRRATPDLTASIFGEYSFECGLKSILRSYTRNAIIFSYHFVVLIGDVEGGVVLLVGRETVHGSLVPVVGQLRPNYTVYFAGEGRMVVVGTWTDSALVEHSVQSDLVQTLLKQRLRRSCATALVDHG
jgi:hypothetical protein